MTKIDSPTFPNFYAECAYHDGYRDQTAGHCNSVPSYRRGDAWEPIGYSWYLLGRDAAIDSRTRKMIAELPEAQREMLRLKGMIE